MIHKNLTGTGVKSKYVGVCYTWNGTQKKGQWASCHEFEGKKISHKFPYTSDGERQAAICYDKMRLENGLEPVNILKRK